MPKKVEEVMDPELSAKAPPVDNEHVAPECEPFSDATVQHARIARLLDLLRAVEWGGREIIHVHQRRPTCPLCKQHTEHAEGCQLKAEIQ